MRASWWCVVLLGCSGPNPRPEGTFTLHQQPVGTCSDPLPQTATLWISDRLPDVRLDGIPGNDVLVTDEDAVDGESNVRFAVTLQMPHEGSPSVWSTWRYRLWGDAAHLEGTAEYTEYDRPPDCPHAIESVELP